MEDIKNIVSSTKDLEAFFQQKRAEINIKNGYLLLIGKRGKTNFREEIIQKYLNSIIDMNDVKNPKVVVFTGGEFNYTIQDKSIVNAAFKDYQIYQILDGTRVSLWWDGKQWILSTRKMIFANEVIWKNNKTYMDVFMDVLVHNKLTMDIFDKEMSYNLIIKHPIHHLFQQNPDKEIKTIHVINVFDVKECKLIPPNDFGNKYGIPCQDEWRGQAFSSLEDIFMFNKGSVANYIEKGTVNYGFILKTKNYLKTKEYSNVIIYSDIYKVIKNAFYNRKKFAVYKNIDDTIDNRVVLISVTYEDNEVSTFVKLFPQYGPRITQYRVIIDNIIARLCEFYTGKEVKLMKISTYIKEYIEKNNLMLSNDPSVINNVLREVVKNEEIIKHIIQVVAKLKEPTTTQSLPKLSKPKKVTKTDGSKHKVRTDPDNNNLRPKTKKPAKKMNN
jgi:hypothetical protein